MSKFMCLCHGKMIDTDTRKPCRLIMKYVKSYDRYWTGEHSAIQIQDPYNLHQDALWLSSNVCHRQLRKPPQDSHGCSQCMKN